MSLKKKGFEVILSSPPEYERLVAEIFLDGKYVALVSQERGPATFDLEFPSADLQEDMITRKVAIDGFSDALAMAISRLRGDVK